MYHNKTLPYLASQTRELGNVGVAEELLCVEPLLGEAPDAHGQGGNLLLERRLPAQVAVSVCCHQFIRVHHGSFNGNVTAGYGFGKGRVGVQRVPQCKETKALPKLWLHNHTYVFV